MFDITIAPAGGKGAFPLLLGVGVGIGTGVGVGAGVGVVTPELEPDEPVEVVEPALPDELVVVPEEDEVPVELPVDPANCVVVVPGDRVRAFEPPHPVIHSAAMARAAMAQIPFRFNCMQ
jgi:hypothetical protein